jgi:LysM repeat protein
LFLINNYFIMQHRTILILLTLLFFQSLEAQTSSNPIYVLYSPHNMDVLDYRTAYASTTTTYYAYALKSGADRHLMYTGTGIYAQNLPSGTVSSSGLSLTDDLRRAINSKSRKLYIAQQLQQGYYLLEVTSVTKITKAGWQYVVTAPNYMFALDSNNINIGYQLALAGSESAVSLTNYGVRNNCRTVYSFRRAPYVAGQTAAEFEMIPDIGILTERSGRDANEMQSNQIMLWGVNGLPLDDYLRQNCQRIISSTTLPPPPPPVGSVVYPDSRPGDAVMQGPTQYGVPNSPISGYPTVNCPTAIRSGYHIVQPKETLNGIARYYGVTTKQLMAWNGIKEANKISICQEIAIAGGMNVAPKTPTATGTGGGGMKVIQQNRGNQTIDQRTITIAPPTNPNITYQPVQPQVKQQLPDLISGGGSTGGYVAPSPVSPSVPSTTTSIVTTYTTVQPREGISAVARRMGCSEALVRQLNGFPAKGNVPLNIGQQLVVCYNGNTPTTPNTVVTTVPNTAPSFNSSVYTDPLPPVSVQPAPKPAARTPISWQDYSASGSETLNDIAYRRGFSSGELAEIATLNGISNAGAVLEKNRRISLPIYENSQPDPALNRPPQGATPTAPTNTAVASGPTTPPFTSNTNTAELPPLTMSTTPGTTKPGFVPLGGSTTPVTTTPAATNPATVLPQSLKVRTPLKWEFYYPRDAESLVEIGRKRKYSANEVKEIATVNGIEDINKPLPPGSKIELPLYRD